jgi:hypothetical protein
MAKVSLFSERKCSFADFDSRRPNLPLKLDPIGNSSRMYAYLRAFEHSRTDVQKLPADTSAAAEKRKQRREWLQSQPSSHGGKRLNGVKGYLPDDGT